MLQVIQSIGSGKLSVAQVPAPTVKPGHVLIQNVCSLISAGTEKSVVDTAGKSLIGKAAERPDKVRQVLNIARTEGLATAFQQATEKLREPIALGYSSTGIVLGCGAGVQEFKPGDRVASNGPHAGTVCIPKNLCARVDPSVPFEQAAFTVLGSIALQGVRLSKLGLGETVLVIGLGLVGQITVQLLKAQGCRVLGMDLDEAKCELARELGADHASHQLNAEAVQELTGGIGADVVLITAATKSNSPVQMAGEAVRQKGRVVVVGAVGLELPRKPYYLREAEFMISCSYGPGRYDPVYEERGNDYPVGYVRWTEQRNMQAVLDMMSAGKLDTTRLVSHRFELHEAEKAYDLIRSGREPYLGVLLHHPDSSEEESPHRVQLRAAAASGKVGIGCLGAGGFARMVLLPAILRTAKFRPYAICSAGGLSGTVSGKRLGFEVATTDEDDLIYDPNVDVVFTVTRHDHHARQVLKCLQAGKHVFVEKPLCRTLEELREIESVVQANGDHCPLLMVGFNRRFSPAALQMKEFFEDVSAPLTASIRFNAGHVPPSHWTQDEDEGGGRIIGEACHAIDLATYLVGSPPVRVFAESIGGVDAPSITDDQCFITLRHENGSISNIAYLSGGNRAYSKERVELIGGGRLAVIDDFRELVLCRGTKQKKKKMRQDKGHRAEIEAFSRAVVEGGDAPISWTDLRSVTLASLLAVTSIREGMPMELHSK